MLTQIKGLNKKLTQLIQLDIDASFCYEQAIRKIEEEDIRQELTSFKDDHDRHADILSAELSKIGEEAPERRSDLKGMFLKGATAMQSVTGTIGALKAMQLNEKLTNRTYAKAAKWKAGDEIADIIQRNFEDEKNHLQYLNDKLDELTVG
ncbi:MAG: ferritin-like domain-containing protein [Candidatus Omnitrophota bacterium]